MFENIIKFFKNIGKKEEKKETGNSKDAAKERLHLVLMQDRANVSTDFLELMKQEIIEVIKKYIEVDESAIDVRLTNKENDDGTNGAPALYANIPILNIKKENKKQEDEKENEEEKTIDKENTNEDKKEEKIDDKTEKMEIKEEIELKNVEEKNKKESQLKEEEQEIKKNKVEKSEIETNKEEKQEEIKEIENNKEEKQEK